MLLIADAHLAIGSNAFQGIEPPHCLQCRQGVTGSSIEIQLSRFGSLLLSKECWVAGTASYRVVLFVLATERAPHKHDGLLVL